jgi:hypothetical protein
LDVIRLALVCHDYTGYMHRLRWVIKPENFQPQKQQAFLSHRPSVRLHKDLFLKWQRGAEPPRETIGDLLEALKDHSEISAFLKTLSPAEPADLDMLVRKILAENRGPLQDWQIILLLLQELKSRIPYFSGQRESRESDPGWCPQ